MRLRVLRVSRVSLFLFCLKNVSSTTTAHYGILDFLLIWERRGCGGGPREVSLVFPFSKKTERERPRKKKNTGQANCVFLSFFNRLSPTRSPRLKFVKLTPNAPRSTSDIKIELASKRKKEKSSREEKSGSSFLIDGDEQSLSTASSTSPASFSTFPASLAPPAPLKCTKNPFPTETRLWFHDGSVINWTQG